MRRSVVLAIAIGVTALVRCKPDFGERESLVTRTQVLAVRGEPAETKPGESATYAVLVATPGGPLATPLASWAFCATPKLLTENGAVSAACLGSGVTPIADGPTATAVTPAGACALFGPEVTSADLRPRDPDVTGGFYQPVRVTVFSGDESAVAFGAERLSCKLGGVNVDVAADYEARYRANQNPALLPLEASLDGAPVALDAIPRGARVTLRAAWPEGAAEAYVAVDPVTQALVDRREWLRVSWFVTAGELESDRTGREEGERETFTDNAWTAPDDARTTHLFVVLRDARGGVTWATYAIATR